MRVLFSHITHPIHFIYFRVRLSVIEYNIEKRSPSIFTTFTATQQYAWAAAYLGKSSCRSNGHSKATLMGMSPDGHWNSFLKLLTCLASRDSFPSFVVDKPVAVTSGGLYDL